MDVFKGEMKVVGVRRKMKDLYFLLKTLVYLSRVTQSLCTEEGQCSQCRCLVD